MIVFLYVCLSLTAEPVKLSITVKIFCVPGLRIVGAFTNPNQASSGATASWQKLTLLAKLF